MEVLEECERAVAGEEIYQVAVLCARAPLDVGGGIEVEGL